MVPVWAVVCNFRLTFQDFRVFQLTLVAAGVSVIGEDGDRVVGTRHCAIITSTSRW